MKRKQIYLEEGCEQRLKALSRRTGRSEASLIREALKSYLEEHDKPLPGDQDSPLLDLLGLVKDGPEDGALRHDSYLYGARD
jgi:hypothetical protein